MSAQKAKVAASAKIIEQRQAQPKEKMAKLQQTLDNLDKAIDSMSKAALWKCAISPSKKTSWRNWPRIPVSASAK